MKLIATLLIGLALAGCASNRYNGSAYQPQAMSYEQLAKIQVDDVDCPRVDSILDNMRRQLAIKGLADRNPEDMTESDRLYNTRAKVVIWALLIGCNNPDRYKK